MVNGKSLVGLTHNEAVEVLKATQKLVQLVVATESTEGESVASSLQSIPEAVAARRAYYNPPSRSFSPLSVDLSSSASAIGIGPELQQLPQRNSFLKEANASGLELKLKTEPSLHPVTAESGEMETKFEEELPPLWRRVISLKSSVRSLRGREQQLTKLRPFPSRRSRPSSM